MNRSIKLAAPLLLALAASACNAGGSSSLPVSSGQTTAFSHESPAQADLMGRRACNDTRPGYMNCDVLIESEGVTPNVPAGWGPSGLEAAYALPIKKGAGQVVAVVDAFDNPNVGSDLAMYRKEFGLGKVNFTKYNQRGQKKNYPIGNPGWGVEIDLDVAMVSASCPLCTIILIEADNNNTNNLYVAEKEAVKLGAHIVTNSYGGGGGSPSGGAFDHKGVTYLASAGDFGYGMQDPADYDTVVSVGGTVLSLSGSTYKEVVWPLSGAGCSVVSKPAWQKDPKCKKRTGNDISAVAQGVAVYDTYGHNGWGAVGGTSVSSPLMAGVFALAGNAATQNGGESFWTLTKKQREHSLHYISSGSVTKCPTKLMGTYLCQAGTEQYGFYSGPTGWGSPKGIGAF